MDDQFSTNRYSQKTQVMEHTTANSERRTFIVPTVCKRINYQQEEDEYLNSNEVMANKLFRLMMHRTGLVQPFPCLRQTAADSDTEEQPSHEEFTPTPSELSFYSSFSEISLETTSTHREEEEEEVNPDPETGETTPPKLRPHRPTSRTSDRWQKLLQRRLNQMNGSSISGATTPSSFRSDDLSFPTDVEDGMLDRQTIASWPRMTDFTSQEDLMDNLFEVASLRHEPIPEDRYTPTKSLSGSVSSLYPPEWTTKRGRVHRRKRPISEEAASARSFANMFNSKGSRSEPTLFSPPATRSKFLSTSGTTEEDFYLGRIKIGLSYVSGKKKILAVKILQARDLRPPRPDETDPSTCVRFYFLPGGSKHQAETNVVNKSCEPVWNEIFLFEGFSRRRLKGRILIVRVKEKQQFGFGAYGRVMIPLDFLYYRMTKRSVQMWKFIRPDEEDEVAGVEKAGQIQLSLTYRPRDSMVVFGILKAIDLRNTSVTTVISPFVRITVKLGGEHRIFSKATNNISHSLNPEWREYHEMPINTTDIDKMTVDISVKDGGVRAIGLGNFLGRVRLGMGTRGEGTLHWRKMITHPRVEMIMWHHLSSDIIN